MKLRVLLEEQTASHSALFAEIIFAMFDSKYTSDKRTEEERACIPHWPDLPI